MVDSNSPGPGRSTSEAAIDELKKGDRAPATRRRKGGAEEAQSAREGVSRERSCQGCFYEVKGTGTSRW
jgi:hypothetical protein